MTADVFGQTVHHQAGTNLLGLKQIGRRHGVIHHINQPMLSAKLADTRQICNLCTRVSDGFHEHHASLFCHSGGHCVYRRCIDKAHIDIHLAKGIEQTVGVAKQKRAGNDVIARSQQGKHCGANRGHASTEADTGNTTLHDRDLRLQRSDRRVDLPAIAVATFCTLKNRRQFPGIVIPVSNVGVDRLM